LAFQQQAAAFWTTKIRSRAEPGGGEKAKAAAIGADKKALSHLAQKNSKETGRLRAKSKEIPPPKKFKNRAISWGWRGPAGR
jgi:hypothetical protein